MRSNRVDDFRFAIISIIFIVSIVYQLQVIKEINSLEFAVRQNSIYLKINNELLEKTKGFNNER